MLTIAYAVNFLGMILLPIILWIYFTRKFSLSWKLVLAGGLTFIASQILHIPLVLAMGPLQKNVSLLINAIILGLLAGLFEETARYILFKFVLKNMRSWKEGLLVGLGHGGIEALLLGLLGIFGFLSMLALRSGDLSMIPADQLEAVRQQVTAYWSAPWYAALMGFVERLLTIWMHVSWSVMVLYAVAYRKPIWFWLAVLAHALVDAVAVYVAQEFGIPAAEGIIAIFAIVSLWIIFRMRSMFSDDVSNMAGQKHTETI